LRQVPAESLSLGRGSLPPGSPGGLSGLSSLWGRPGAVTTAGSGQSPTRLYPGQRGSAHKYEEAFDRHGTPRVLTVFCSKPQARIAFCLASSWERRWVGGVCVCAHAWHMLGEGVGGSRGSLTLSNEQARHTSSTTSKEPAADPMGSLPRVCVLAGDTASQHKSSGLRNVRWS
jgi:hypothetical protein